MPSVARLERQIDRRPVGRRRAVTIALARPRSAQLACPVAHGPVGQRPASTTTRSARRSPRRARPPAGRWSSPWRCPGPAARRRGRASAPVRAGCLAPGVPRTASTVATNVSGQQRRGQGDTQHALAPPLRDRAEPVPNSHATLIPRSVRAGDDSERSGFGRSPENVSGHLADRQSARSRFGHRQSHPSHATLQHLPAGQRAEFVRNAGTASQPTSSRSRSALRTAWPWPSLLKYTNTSRPEPAHSPTRSAHQRRSASP